MKNRLLKIGSLVLGALTLAACTGEATGTDEAQAVGGLAFHAEASPLADFSYDTGLVPAGSPAQVQLKLSAGGGLKVEAAAMARDGKLAGKPGGGKLGLDIHLKLDGKLKVDSALKKYEGDLPGLKDIDVPIVGSVAFDPFLTGEGESAEARAELPETTLPEIPLGSVPGSLVLTVVKGSELAAKFHGTCASVAGGQASYLGEASTSGTLVLKGQIVLKLPAPLNKTVDLPEIKVPIPAVVTTLDSAIAAPGLGDSKAGAACAADPTGGSSGDGASGSDGKGGETPPPVDGAVAITLDGVRGTPTKVTAKLDSAQDAIGYAVKIEFTTSKDARPARIEMFINRKGQLCEGLTYVAPGGSTFHPESMYAEGAGGPCLSVTKLPDAKDTHIAGSYAGTLVRYSSSIDLNLVFDVATQK
jgi:hypothetical protein